MFVVQSRSQLKRYILTNVPFFYAFFFGAIRKNGTTEQANNLILIIITINLVHLYPISHSFNPHRRLKKNHSIK